LSAKGHGRYGNGEKDDGNHDERGDEQDVV
jgi:hypothetical protein